MSEEAKKSLRLMTYWLFGTVLIVWAAVIGFVAMWIAPVTPAGKSPVELVLAGSWQILLITGVVAVLIYAGYRFWYLPRGMK